MNNLLKSITCIFAFILASLSSATAQCTIVYANPAFTYASAPLQASTCTFTFMGSPYLLTTGSNCTFKYYKNQAATIAYSGNPVFDASHAGTSVVIYVSTDDGNPSTPEPTTLPFTLNIIDITAPIITCPSNQNATATGLSCNYTFTNSFAPITLSDNCSSNVTYTYSSTGATVGAGNNAPTAAFNVGTSVVKYTAKDVSNNTATCSFNVVVTETVKPTIVCPANMTVNTAPNTCEKQILTGLEAVLNDNCTVMSQNSNLQFLISAPSISAGGGNANFKTFNTGNHTVTYKATDNEGNTATCTFKVLVNDITPPTVTCQSGKVLNTNLDTCITYATIQQLAPFATDNCGSNNLTTTVTATGVSAFSTPTNLSALPNVAFKVGVTVLTMKVTDAFANSATCNMSIQVIDNQAPTIICNNMNKTKKADTLTCDASLLLSNPIYKDNCTSVPNLIISYTLSGATAANANGFLQNAQRFNTGTTVVKYQVQDAANNTSTCSFAINILENPNKKPTLVCKPDTILNALVGACNRLISTGLAPKIATDNCSQNLTLSYSLSGAMSRLDTIVAIGNGVNGLSFPVGTTKIRYILKDAVGNADTCSFNVTIKDIQKPMVTCLSDIQVSAGTACARKIANLKPIATDNCGAVSASFTLSGATQTPVNQLIDSVYFKIGVTKVTWIFADNANNKDTCKYNVTVTETVKPTIICPDNHITIRTSDTSCTAVKVQLPLPTYSDNCTLTNDLKFSYSTLGATILSGNATQTSLTLNKGDNYINYKITDFSQNSATCSILLTVADSTKPQIFCMPAQTYYLADTSCQITLTPAVPIYLDNCGATISYLISGATIKSGSNYISAVLFNKGQSIITYIATDAANNTKQCTFLATVLDTIKPKIICPNNITANTLLASCDEKFTTLTPSLSDNCSTTGLSLIYKINNNTFAPGNANNINFTTGINTVRYVATDLSANSSACSFTVNIVDNVAPIANCKDSVTLILDNTGNATLTSALINNVSMDNCTANNLLNFGLSKSSFNCSNLGFNAVTLTVKDESQNAKTCISTVKILNQNANLNLNPILLPQNESVLNLNDGQITATIQGGIGPFTYVWSNNQTTNTISNLTIGNYIVTITDQTSGCATTANTTLVAGKKMLLSIGNAIGGQNQSVLVPVKVTRFKNIHRIKATIMLPDQLIAQFQSVTDFALTDLDINNFTVNKTTISLDYTSTNPNGFTLADNQVLFNIKTKLVGTIGSSIAIEIQQNNLLTTVQQYVPSGLYSAPYDVNNNIVSIGNASGFADLAGSIKREDGTTYKGAKVVLSGNKKDSIITAATGVYGFNVSVGNNQIIKPFNNLSPKNGVTSYDISIIQRHVLGIQYMASNYNRIAADVNADGKISSSDMLEIRLLVLGINPKFANTPSWKFVPEGFVFPTLFTKVNVFQDSLRYDYILQDKNNGNFVAIKMGDTNGSANSTDSNPVSDRTQSTVLTDLPTANDHENTYTVPIYATDFASNAAQLSLNYNQDNFELQDIDNQDINTSIYKIKEGKINVIWSSPIAKTSSKSNPLTNIVFRKKNKNADINSIEIDKENEMPTKIYNEFGEAFAIQFSSQNVVKNDINIFPNPVHNDLNIELESNNASPVTIRIYDIRGALVSENQKDSQKGNNRFHISLEDILVSPYVIIELITQNGVWKKKVVRI